MAIAFAHLLSDVAYHFLGRSQEIPMCVIRDLTNFLLHTVRKSLDDNSEAYWLSMHASTFRKTWTAHIHKFSNHSIALKIRRVLVEMIISQQIESPDSLYLPVRKAVQALQAAAFSGVPCVIRGEPINVSGAKDEFLVAQYFETHDNGEEGANACLYNLRGTTSYMNAILQCLYHVPELRSALTEWRPLFETSSDHLLTASIRDLFKQLDKSAEPVVPRMVLQLFEEKHHRLEQLNNHNPMDAQVCWLGLLDILSRSLKSPWLSSENLDIVDTLFNIKLVNRVHCRESGEKPRLKKPVRMLKWVVRPTVDNLQEGLRFSLERGLDKPSTLCIDGLPRYLTIRSFRMRPRQKANLTINLLAVDVYDLCSDELRAKLDVTGKGSSDGSGVSSKATWKEGQLTRVYDLVAFVAHKKKPCYDNIKSPGHYTAFIKREKIGGKLPWFHYVDDNVYTRREEYVNQVLRGGSFAPYICLYKARLN